MCLKCPPEGGDNDKHGNRFHEHCSATEQFAAFNRSERILFINTFLGHLSESWFHGSSPDKNTTSRFNTPAEQVHVPPPVLHHTIIRQNIVTWWCFVIIISHFVPFPVAPASRSSRSDNRALSPSQKHQSYAYFYTSTCCSSLQPPLWHSCLPASLSLGMHNI